MRQSLWSVFGLVMTGVLGPAGLALVQRWGARDFEHVGAQPYSTGPPFAEVGIRILERPHQRLKQAYLGGLRHVSRFWQAVSVASSPERGPELYPDLVDAIRREGVLLAVLGRDVREGPGRVSAGEERDALAQTFVDDVMQLVGQVVIRKTPAL